jgi:hypothetical protein
MIDLLEAALEIQNFLLDRQWRFCIIGGLAATRWGEPRVTQDVDISLLTGFGNECRYIEPILGRFHPRIKNAKEFAQENRVLLIKSSNETPIDIGLAGIPFEEKVIARASPFAFSPDASLITCSAEDLIVLKAFADRERDWTAIQGILIAQGDLLDWNYIIEQLVPLCELKEDPDTLNRLEILRQSSR